MPQYNLTVAKARFTQAKVSAEAIRKAQEVFFLENGRYSVDLTELIIQPTGCSILNNGAWCWNEHYTCFVNDTYRDGSGNLVPTVYCSMKNPDVSYYAKPPSAVRQFSPEKMMPLPINCAKMRAELLPPSSMV